tara:strand:+ start:176 stop:634 length:459 start_codon:yes stop_codon:yes gene_type:complete
LKISKLLNSEPNLELLTNPISNSLTKENIIFLEGQVGSGKTTFVRELLSQIAKNKKVQFRFQGSPSFQKINTYVLKDLEILHFDLYNTNTDDKSDLEDYLRDFCVIMEWPTKSIKEIYKDKALFIDISFKNDARIYSIHTENPKWQKVIKSI